MDLPLQPDAEIVEIRWIELRGGPAEGGKITVPVNSFGDIVIHSLPIQVDAWQDTEGDWHAGLLQERPKSTGRAVKYHLDKGEHFATYVDHENPSDESQDWDLPVTRPYLEGESTVRDAS